MSDLQIQHHSAQQRFTLSAGADEAILDYRLSPASASGQASRINFTYTYVPPAFRGKGLAESLVRHGLRWAREQSFDISASCWYVARFLR